MKIKFLLITFFISLATWSQSCGVIDEEINTRHAQYIDSLQRPVLSFDVHNDVPNFYPLTIHIIRDNNGNTNLNLNNLLSEIDLMNDYYLPAGIQFFICQEINYIDNSNYYFFNQGLEETEIGNAYDIPNTINIYFASNVTSSNGSSLCGYAYYPGGPLRIIMSNSCATNGSTLTHEMGHFFGLLHTHGTSNTKNATNELADGSNGATEGDRVQDTPSDPQLTGEVNFNCIYTNNYLDNNGQPHNPDPHNIMSYSRKECRDFISIGQLTVVNLVANSSRSTLICSNFNANFTADTTKICEGPLEVNFIDTSVGAVNWEWDINADGNIDYIGQNITHIYNESGSYNVALTITNNEGKKISKVKNNFINIGGEIIDTDIIKLEITLDNWPTETTWKFVDSNNNILLEENNYQQADRNKTFNYELNLTNNECYSFIITDRFGDGICCSQGPGNYKLLDNNDNILFEGGSFGSIEEINFKTLENVLSIDNNIFYNFKMYPNPFSNTINLNDFIDSYKLYSITGQLVLEGTNKVINTNSINKGFYILVIKKENKTKRFKIIKK